MAEIRTYKWTNFARSTLAAGISDSETEIQINPADSDLFPLPGVDEVFTLVLWDPSFENFEVVYCTARNDDRFTVERGKEGTQAREWSVGSHAVHTATKGLFEQINARPPELVEFLDDSGAAQHLTDQQTASIFFPSLPAGTDNRLIVCVSLFPSTSGTTLSSMTYGGVPMNTQHVHDGEFGVTLAIGVLSVNGQVFADDTLEITRLAPPSGSQRTWARRLLFDNVNPADADFSYFVGTAINPSAGSPDPVSLSPFSLVEGDMLYTTCVADGNDGEAPVLADDTDFNYIPIAFPGGLVTTLNNQGERGAWRVFSADESYTVTWQPETTLADVMSVIGFAVRAEVA